MELRNSGPELAANTSDGEIMGRDISKVQLDTTPLTDELAGAGSGNVGGGGSAVLAGARAKPVGGAPKAGAARDFTNDGPESVRALPSEADGGARQAKPPETKSLA